jgi:hypothetical protein
MSYIRTTSETIVTKHCDKYDVTNDEKITVLETVKDNLPTIEDMSIEMGSWIVLQYQNKSNCTDGRSVIKNFSPFLALVIGRKFNDQATGIQYVVKRKNNYMYDYEVMNYKEAEIFTYVYWGYPVGYVLGHWNKKPTPKEYGSALRKRLPLVSFAHYERKINI